MIAVQKWKVWNPSNRWSFQDWATISTLPGSFKLL
jgi:hypothetical protein